MSRSEGGKRLESRMTRGGFRFMMTMALLMLVLQVAVLALRLSLPWEGVNYLYIAVILVTAGVVGRLLYVRRHDSPFWDQEDAERERWNQRGRQL
jgi:hypothetical protein